MATLDEHLAQWRHNREFLATVDPAYPDWATTAAFYAALHAVSALLLHDRIPAKDHAARNAVLRQTRRYEKIREHYLALYDLSQDARYSADPALWFGFDQLEREVVKAHLYPLERSVQKLLARDLQLPALHLRT